MRGPPEAYSRCPPECPAMIRRDEQRPRKRRPLRLVSDEPAAPQPVALSAAASPTLPLLNRELSWLAFNERVIEEAYDERWPLLERLKFLAISETNLDEFFMIRVSGLLDQLSSEIVEPTDDGLLPAEALARVRAAVLGMELRQTSCLVGDLFPGLESASAHLCRVTRDADIEIQEDEASDLLATIEQEVRRRRFGAVVRLEVAPKTPKRVRKLLLKQLEITA